MTITSAQAAAAPLALSVKAAEREAAVQQPETAPILGDSDDENDSGSPIFDSFYNVNGNCLNSTANEHERFRVSSVVE